MDEFWNCPDHGVEIVTDNSMDDPDYVDWEEHYRCPVEGCTFTRHVS